MPDNFQLTESAISQSEPAFGLWSCEAQTYDLGAEIHEVVDCFEYGAAIDRLRARYVTAC